jgi:integrase
MADIRKRNGPKGIKYQVRYASSEAKSGHAYASFDTMKEARTFSENLGGIQKRTAAGVITVHEAVTRWLEICEKIGRDGREKVEPETFKEYRRRGRVMQEYAWTKALSELASADVVHFRNWLLQTKSRDLARRTLSSFHSMIIEMKHQGFIKDDPAAGITIKSGGRYEDEDSEMEIPSDQEMRDIYAAADVMGNKNDFMEKCWRRYRPMVYLAGFSGMRPSEIRGLPWPHIADAAVHIKQRADKTGIIGPVKSKAGKRTIHLPRVVTDMVFEWKEFCPKSPHGLVFPTDSGKPQALNNFRAGAWLPLMEEAELMVTEKINGERVRLPMYSPYALRHYFASKLIEKGKDLKFIQHTMGHSKIEITLNVYGHLLKGRDDAHKGTAEELATEILGKRRGKSAEIRA